MTEQYMEMFPIISPDIRKQLARHYREMALARGEKITHDEPTVKCQTCGRIFPAHQTRRKFTARSYYRKCIWCMRKKNGEKR